MKQIVNLIFNLKYIMSNMSYCRFENTSNDLEDVVDNWEESDNSDLSEYELRGKMKILKLAREIVNMEGM